jgi:hypothetical protein
VAATKILAVRAGTITQPACLVLVDSSFSQPPAFLVKVGSGLRPRTKRVKNDCTLSADYYNINSLNNYIFYYY